MKTKISLEELISCAILQGFGLDLRPMSNHNFIELGTYLRLKEISLNKMEKQNRKTKMGEIYVI